LEVVTETLLYEHFAVKGISFGHLLFNAIENFKPDLILLDYKLADTNGGDLCAQLKNDPLYHHIPVIIFSAYFHPSENIRPGGCDDMLYKPFDLENLL
jgi:DNA-binding response OmpR family regulator